MTTQSKPAWFEEFEKNFEAFKQENTEQHAALESKVDSVYALASATSTYVHDLPDVMTRIVEEEVGKHTH